MKKTILQLTLFIATLCVSLQSWAFASAVEVIGDVTVLSMQGDARTLQKGDRIEVKETVITAGGSEVLIKTDNQSLLILKSNSKLLIQVAPRSADGILVARLLKGSLYGDATALGASKSRKHHISTSYGKAKLENAKYEIAIQEKQSEAATYLKVVEGSGRLIAREISVALKAQDLAKSTNRSTPSLLVLEPDAVFVKAALESQLATVNINAERSLQEKSDDKVAEDCVQNSPARKVLDDFIRAYELGDIAYIQRRLDPAMIGYSAMLSNMMKDVNIQKQTRFLIQNHNVQCGPDLAVINFTWEKRFLDLATFRPRLQTGQAAVLTHLKKGEWKLSGVSGDNPFAPRLSKPTTLVVSPNAVNKNVVGIVPIISQIRLVSSDLEGAGVVQVEALASNGDRETFNLTEVQPGIFVKTNFNAIDVPPVLNDGSISITANSVVTITFQYKNPITGLVAKSTIRVTEI